MDTNHRAVTRPWFRARRYGYGWTPQTRQGWAAVVAFIAADVLLWIVLAVTVQSDSLRVAVGVPVTLALTTALIALCYARGERPRRRWG